VIELVLDEIKPRGRKSKALIENGLTAKQRTSTTAGPEQFSLSELGKGA
jgi:hypothetical protein